MDIFFFDTKSKNHQKQPFFHMKPSYKKSIASILVSIPSIFPWIKWTSLKTKVSIGKLLSRRLDAFNQFCDISCVCVKKRRYAAQTF